MSEIGYRNVPCSVISMQKYIFFQKKMALIGRLHYFEIKNQCNKTVPHISHCIVVDFTMSLYGYPDTTVELGDHVRNMCMFKGCYVAIQWTLLKKDRHIYIFITLFPWRIAMVSDSRYKQPWHYFSSRHVGVWFFYGSEVLQSLSRGRYYGKMYVINKRITSLISCNTRCKDFIKGHNTSRRKELKWNGCFPLDYKTLVYRHARESEMGVLFVCCCF